MGKSSGDLAAGRAPRTIGAASGSRRRGGTTGEVAAASGSGGKLREPIACAELTRRS